jgi:hypothetical protein
MVEQDPGEESGVQFRQLRSSDDPQSLGVPHGINRSQTAASIRVSITRSQSSSGFRRKTRRSPSETFVFKKQGQLVKLLNNRFSQGRSMGCGLAICAYIEGISPKEDHPDLLPPLTSRRDLWNSWADPPRGDRSHPTGSPRLWDRGTAEVRPADSRRSRSNRPAAKDLEP